MAENEIITDFEPAEIVTDFQPVEEFEPVEMVTDFKPVEQVKDWTGEVGIRGKTIPSEIAAKKWEGSYGITSKLGVIPRGEYQPEFYRDRLGNILLNKYNLPAGQGQLEPSAGTTSPISEDPVVGLTMGAVMGGTTAAKAGQSAFQIAKGAGGEALSGVTWGGSDIARLVGKGGLKVLKSKAIQDKIIDSADFLNTLYRNMNTTAVEKDQILSRMIINQTMKDQGFSGTHRQIMRNILKSPEAKNITDIPVEKINTLSADEIYRMGNKVTTADSVEKIAPVVNRLSERLSEREVSEIINNNIDKIEKLGESELVKELSNAIYRKAKIGRYGSVTKIVNNQKIIDGTKTMPVYEAEMNLLKDLPVLEKQQRLLEPSNRYFDKVPQLKEILYQPAQKAEHLSKIEYGETIKALNSVTKGLSRNSSERIMTYAVAQQKGGADILNTMKKTVPELISKEIQAYDFMRGKYEELYNRLNEARKISGKQPFDKVDNYFTFFKQLDNVKEKGFNPVLAQQDIINEYVNRNTTPFIFAKKRVKSKAPVELDAYNVFRKYLNSALEHIHLSPVISKTNKLNRILYTGAVKEGKKETFKLFNKNPHLSDFLRNWSGDLAGKKLITKIGGTKLELLDDWAAKANKNLVYSVLSYNVRSALMQPLAARNTLVEIGLGNTLKGVNMNLSSKWRNFAMKKSNILNTRIFESGVQEAMSKTKGISKKLGDLGIKPLQYLDMETARGTWLGAFNKGVKDKMTMTEAINYADDVVTRTQGSAAKMDRTPITRTATGKALALFQTFATADYQFLKKDILGIGKQMSKKEIFAKLMKYMAATEVANIALEQAGVDTPFPNPYQVIKESAQKGDNDAVTAIKVIKDLASIHPMLGSMKYGRTLGGSALNTLQKAAEDLETRKELDLSKFIVDVIKVTGVPGVGAIPGLGEIERYLKIKNLGESNWKALTGKYPDKKKKIKLNKFRGL